MHARHADVPELEAKVSAGQATQVFVLPPREANPGKQTVQLAPLPELVIPDPAGLRKKEKKVRKIDEP